MKNFKLLLLSLFSASAVTAQVQVCLGDDATVCQGQTVQITNCGGGGVGGGSGIYLNAPTNLTLSDDQWSGVVNVGFPISFYGNTYSQCVIGSNGLVSFNTANANGG